MNYPMSYTIAYAQIIFICLLIALLYRVYKWATRGRRSRMILKDWAVQNDYALYKIDRKRKPQNVVDLRRFTGARSRTGGCFYLIEAVDTRHIRRRGLARVTPLSTTGGAQLVQVVWLTARQLDWRDQPPRGVPAPPGTAAQGWHIDPTGKHELRWFSAGTPTDVVIDGAVEGRDPPIGTE